MGKSIKERKDVDTSLTWDLSALFKTEEKYQEAVNEAEALTLELEAEFKGRLDSAVVINQCLDKLRRVMQKIHLVQTYAQLSLSVDQTDSASQGRSMKLTNLVSSLDSRLSFVKSEI